MNVADIHPCYSHDAHFKYGRVHLPVAPRCNIRCNYCDRCVSDCHHVFRPGVSARVVNSADAVELAGRALESEPRIRVAGIAGPGEPLANGETFATLQAIYERFPHLVLYIVPLIPLGDFKHRRPPTCDELRAARETGERFLPQFRHCLQCRADAVGVPGDGDRLPGR